MRFFIAVLFVFSFALSGCVAEEPQCPDDEDTVCTCDDGTEGTFVCTNGAGSCVCGDGDADGDEDE